MNDCSGLGCRAVEIARRWIGTPYVHRASLRGAGCDCLGLVRGVWRELLGCEAEAPPAYAPLWAETGEGNLLAGALRRHMDEVPVREMAIGDVLLFRFRRSDPARHVAILSRPSRMIHAYADRGVMETAFGGWWRHRLASVFRFPVGRAPLAPSGHSPRKGGER